MAEYTNSATDVFNQLTTQVDAATLEAIRAALPKAADGSISPVTVVTDYKGGAVTVGTDIVYIDKAFSGPLGQELANVSTIIVPQVGNTSIVLSGGVDRTIVLGGGNDVVTITGTTADTVRVVPGGNDTINLGGGFDRAVVAQKFSDFTTTATADGVSLVNKATGETTTVVNTEYVQFSDGTVVINAQSNTDAALAKFYEIVFDRTAEFSGTKFWFGADNAAVAPKLSDLANGFLRSAEFTQKFGAVDTLSNTQFLSTIYQSSFGRATDANGLAFWTNALQTGQVTKADVVVFFTQSAELDAKTAGLINLTPSILPS
ncbi:MAG: DUF4214 domain-containing protein [Beijerinckiaceae bacterium]